MSARLEYTEQVCKALSRYETAETALHIAKNAVLKADNELADAKLDIAKFLIPTDAVVGEQFNLWVGSRLLTVTKNANGCTLSWRKGGKV